MLLQGGRGLDASSHGKGKEVRRDGSRRKQKNNPAVFPKEQKKWFADFYKEKGLLRLKRGDKEGGERARRGEGLGKRGASRISRGVRRRDKLPSELGKALWGREASG